MSKRIDLAFEEDPINVKGGEKSLPKERPLLVLFYMNGCPHCESNQAAWESAKKKLKGGVATAEIESIDVPASESVNGFPTMKYYPASGAPAEISGSQPSGDVLLKKLGVPAVGGRRRLRSRRARHRGGRKLGHRTLRSYITL